MKTAEGPLMIIEGKGEDEEDEPEDDEEELEKEEEPVRKKGKVIITKPPKPTTTIFTRRSRKKGAKDESEVTFYRPPPTFEERLKKLRAGVGINNFKALKYETQTPVEKKEIKDLIMENLGIWKYSLEQFAPQISADLPNQIRDRWESTVQTVKDIFEKKLK